MPHKYVLDAHALVWYLEGNLKLAPNAKSIMDHPNSEMVLPIIGLVEAALVVEKGRSTIPSPADFVSDVQTDHRIEVYPLTWEVFKQSLTATAIPEIHDRLIVATALHLQRLGHTVSLLTKDLRITQSGLIPVVW